MASARRQSIAGSGARPALDDLARRIDRRSTVPLYYQLQDILFQAIRSQRWAAGDRLPAESELGTAFGVSRAVVREALKILEDDGEIIRRQGLGTYVADPRLDHVAGGLVRFAAEQAPVGIGVEVLETHDVEVDENLRQMLGTGTVLRVDWLLTSRQEPLAVAYSHLPSERLPEFARKLRGGGGALPPLGRLVSALSQAHEAEVSVLTSSAAHYPAERLHVEPRSPVFVVTVTEVARLNGERVVVEFARLIYRSDRASLHMEAGSSNSDGEGSITTRIVALDRG